MKPEELKRNIRTEKAFRHISAGLLFFATGVLGIMILSAYLKFDPEIGEEITDGKLKQFIDDTYENRALIKLALLSVLTGITCFLPAKFASVSLFMSAATYAFLLQTRAQALIETYPNGFLAVYSVFFGASICCAALRIKNNRVEGKEPIINGLHVLSAAICAGMALLCFKLNALTVEYANYNRFEKFVEDAEEKTFGDFELVVSKLELNAPDILTRQAIILIFAAAIILVLYRFPRLASLVPLYLSGYTLYLITIDKIAAMTWLFFFSMIMAFAALVAIPSRNPLPAVEPTPDEIDENADEDGGEDDAEYEENKKNLEKNGLEMEDYDS